MKVSSKDLTVGGLLIPLLVGLSLFDGSGSQAIAKMGSKGSAKILRQFQACLPTTQYPAGDRDCIEKLQQRLLARPEERKAFYRYVSARLPCGRDALNPVVRWFYHLYLEARGDG